MHVFPLLAPQPFIPVSTDDVPALLRAPRETCIRALLDEEMS